MGLSAKRSTGSGVLPEFPRRMVKPLATPLATGLSLKLLVTDSGERTCTCRVASLAGRTPSRLLKLSASITLVALRLKSLLVWRARTSTTTVQLPPGGSVPLDTATCADAPCCRTAEALTGAATQDPVAAAPVGSKIAPSVPALGKTSLKLKSVSATLLSGLLIWIVSRPGSPPVPMEPRKMISTRWAGLPDAR